MSSHQFSVGVEVKTHSLRASEKKYNGMTGTVMGAVTVNRNNARRVLVSVGLPDGSKKSMLLHLRNLEIIANAEDCTDIQAQFHDAVLVGDAVTIKKCLQLGMDVNDLCSNGFPPVYTAAMNGARSRCPRT